MYVPHACVVVMVVVVMCVCCMTSRFSGTTCLSHLATHPSRTSSQAQKRLPELDRRWPFLFPLFFITLFILFTHTTPQVQKRLSELDRRWLSCFFFLSLLIYLFILFTHTSPQVQKRLSELDIDPDRLLPAGFRPLLLTVRGMRVSFMCARACVRNWALAHHMRVGLLPQSSTKHTCAHAHTHAHTHTHTPTHTHAHSHTQSHTHTHMHARA